MTILGIGNDIIEVKRIEKCIEKYQQKFLDRIFTLAEQAYCLKYREAARNFAGRFAAKEAVVKALGTGFGSHASWLDIEVIKQKSGKPTILLSERLLNNLPENTQILISISHSHDYATAVALWVKDQR